MIPLAVNYRILFESNDTYDSNYSIKHKLKFLTFQIYFLYFTKYTCIRNISPKEMMINNNGILDIRRMDLYSVQVYMTRACMVGTCMSYKNN